MNSIVFRSRYYFEVINSIIRTVMILMVNMLKRFEFSSNMIFHNQTMLKIDTSITWKTNFHIAFIVPKLAYFFPSFFRDTFPRTSKNPGFSMRDKVISTLTTNLNIGFLPPQCTSIVTEISPCSIWKLFISTVNCFDYFHKSIISNEMAVCK